MKRIDSKQKTVLINAETIVKFFLQLASDPVFVEAVRTISEQNGFHKDAITAEWVSKTELLISGNYKDVRGCQKRPVWREGFNYKDLITLIEKTGKKIDEPFRGSSSSKGSEGRKKGSVENVIEALEIKIGILEDLAKVEDRKQETYDKSKERGARNFRLKLEVGQLDSIESTISRNWLEIEKLLCNQETITNQKQNVLPNLGENEITISESPYELKEVFKIDCVYLVIELQEKTPKKHETENTKYIVKPILAIPQSTTEYKYYKIDNLFDREAGYAQAEIEEKFPELIKKSNKITENFNSEIDPQIIIEWMIPYDLISSNFEFWEEEGTQICRAYPSVYIRSVERSGIRYKHCRNRWRNKWKHLQDNLSSIDHSNYILAERYNQTNRNQLENWFLGDELSIIGINFSANLKEIEDEIYKLFLQSGIPLALWSRYKNAQVNHISELDRLINPDNQSFLNLQNLSSSIKNRRFEAKPEQEEDLGHHLCFLWENPYSYPLKGNFEF